MLDDGENILEIDWGLSIRGGMVRKKIWKLNVLEVIYKL